MKHITFTLIAFLYLNTITAQYSIQDILSAPFPSDLTAASQSEKVAWVLNVEGVRNIWMLEGEVNQAKPLTNFTADDGQAISQLIFKEDSDELIFVRGGAPNRRGEIPNPLSSPDAAKRYIFKTKLDGKGILDTLAEGSNPLLSNDGSTLAFLKKGQVWYYDFKQKKAKQAFQIRGSAGGLNWSPDGSKLAFVSNRGDHSFIGVYDVAKHQIQYLQPSVDKDSNPVWSPDGQSLAFMRIENNRILFIWNPNKCQ
ncbi:MAG: S9 family peptidase, partial [Bacteroidota bacterium]